MAKRKLPAKPVIRHTASISSLAAEYGDKTDRKSVEQKLGRIRKAGFDGFTGRVPIITGEIAENSGLIFVASIDIGGKSEIKPKFRAIKKAGARCVNVQMLDHDTPTRRAVDVTRRVMAVADELDMDVSIEVHRDTCTETPEKAYALAAGFERAEKRPLKMTWDFSHPAVIKHLYPPYWDRLAERPDLIKLANQIHFRPFNGRPCPDPGPGQGR
jgi:sugar phosphate isomerase/epimerase